MSVYLLTIGIMLWACCSSASSLEIQTGIFSKSVTLWTALQIPLWSKTHLLLGHEVYDIALSKVLAKCSLNKWEWLSSISQLVWIVQIWPIFASQQVNSTGTCAQLCFGLLVSCYSLLQHSRPAWLELFVHHTHTHSMNNLRWQLHWLPRLTSLLRKSSDWWRSRDSSLGQPPENKRLKTNIFFLIFFNLIKSQTRDSSVNHFDGHFAHFKPWTFPLTNH